MITTENQMTDEKFYLMLRRYQFKADETYLPFANTPEHIITMFRLLANQKDKTGYSTNELGNLMEMTPRHINFYGEAGERAFGIFERDEKNWVLSEIGQSFIDYDNEQNLHLISYMQTKINNNPVFQPFFKNKELTIVQIESKLKDNEMFREHFSDSSLHRRASSIRSWIKWFQGQNILLDDEVFLYFLEMNKNLLWKAIHSVHPHDIEMELLYSDALYALSKALMNYDIHRGKAKFTTYLFLLVQNEVKVRYRYLNRIRNEKSVPFESFRYQPHFEDEENVLKDDYVKEEEIIPIETVKQDEYIKYAELRDMLKPVIHQLDKRSQYIFLYGMLNNVPQRILAKKLKLSQAAISKQILKIRKWIKLNLNEDLNAINSIH